MIAHISSCIIKIGFALLFILVPLILTPWNYELFEFNKMMLVYALTAVVVGAWVIKMLSEKELRLARTPLDIPIALFFTSQLVSTIFSIDPFMSWFGYYSRFNGGMWSVICYVLLYYAFVTNKQDIPRILTITLTSGTLVAIYGVLERFGIDKNLWVQDVQTRVFSTLGQPNWLAAYLVALTPLALAFGIKQESQESKVKSNHSYVSLRFLAFLLLTVLLFLVLLFTRSRSGLLGFAIADVVFWIFLFIKLSKEKIKIPFFIFHFALCIIVFINGTSIEGIDKFVSFHGITSRLTRSVTQVASPSAQPVGPALETGGTESGTIRKYVWEGAVNAWRSSVKTMLVGTGTETFALAFYQFKPPAHNLTSEWDFLYNKAHNEYLNYLATTGIFGLGSYLLFIGTFVVWFLKSQYTIHNIQQGRKNLNWSLDIGNWILNIALFSGWLSILVTNFFGFSVVIVQIFFFLFPAMVLSLFGIKNYRNFKMPLGDASLSVLQFAAGIGSVLIIVSLANLWRADVAYALGYRANRYGNYDVAERFLTRAIALYPAAPLYHDERATAIANLAVAAINDKQATKAAELARLSLEESDRTLTISPRNVTFWKTRTKIFYGFADFDPSFTKQAIQSMNVAYALSPVDPKIAYNLAVLYGQNGDTQKALELFNQAMTLKPNYRDAYWGLYVLSIEAGQQDRARAVLKQYLDTVDPTDKEFLERIK